MNFSQMIVASAVAGLSVFAASAALAQDGYRAIDGGRQDPFQSTLSREQVQSELQQAQREGRIAHSEVGIDRALFMAFKSSLSRAQVRAEAVEARRLGLLDGSGDGASRSASAEQAESIRRAGLRAVEASTLAAVR